MHFDGDPINYVSFMRNFETCLEDDADNSRNLHFLIQYCTGKARDATESCVNLPVSEGYESAKKTLEENFGLPHVIAKVEKSATIKSQHWVNTIRICKTS